MALHCDEVARAEGVLPPPTVRLPPPGVRRRSLDRVMGRRVDVDDRRSFASRHQHPRSRSGHEVVAQLDGSPPLPVEEGVTRGQQEEPSLGDASAGVTASTDWRVPAASCRNVHLPRSLRGLQEQTLRFRVDPRHRRLVFRGRDGRRRSVGTRISRALVSRRTSQRSPRNVANPATSKRRLRPPRPRASKRRRPACREHRTQIWAPHPPA